MVEIFGNAWWALGLRRFFLSIQNTIPNVRFPSQADRVSMLRGNHAKKRWAIVDGDQ